MTRAQMDGYRRLLLALKQRLTGDVSQLTGEALRENQKEASGNLSSMPIHMADIGSDNFEQEFTLNLLANEEQAIQEIDAALERLREGTFGRCEECGGAIPQPRLKALPYARYCVECARKLEHS